MTKHVLTDDDITLWVLAGKPCVHCENIRGQSRVHCGYHFGRNCQTLGYEAADGGPLYKCQFKYLVRGYGLVK